MYIAGDLSSLLSDGVFALPDVAVLQPSTKLLYFMIYDSTATSSDKQPAALSMNAWVAAQPAEPGASSQLWFLFSS